MKIAKLSLAAIIATTALTTVASAAPLEDVIKNAEINGYMRWRYTYLTEKNVPHYLLKEVNERPWDNPGILPPTDSANQKNNIKKGKAATAKNEFKSIIDLKFGIDDNFYSAIGVQLSWDDNAKSNPHYDGASGSYYSEKGYSKTNETFQTKRMYLGYKNGGTDIRVGRQEVGSFFTDDLVGDGIKVINKDIEGMTLIGAAYNSINEDGDISTLQLKRWDSTLNNGNGGYRKLDKTTAEHNVYALGAIGKYEPMNFQLWSTVVEDVAALFAVDVNRDFEISEDMGFGLHGQYVNSSLKSKFKDDVAKLGFETPNKKGGLSTVGAGDTNWWAIESGLDAFGFDFTLGYIGYKVDGGQIGMVSFEDNGDLIDPGEDLYNWAMVMGKANYVFTSLGYSFLDEKVRIGGDYSYGKLKFADNKYDQWEAVARINYKHSKKLEFKTFYSWLSDPIVNGTNSPKYKSQKYRFEAKYFF